MVDKGGVGTSVGMTVGVAVGKRAGRAPAVSCPRSKPSSICFLIPLMGTAKFLAEIASLPETPQPYRVYSNNHSRVSQQGPTYTFWTQQQVRSQKALPH